MEPGIIRANERLKGIASLFFNLGGAVVGAVAVRMYAVPGVDFIAALWCTGAVALIWIAYMLLGLLQSEEIA